MGLGPVLSAEVVLVSDGKIGATLIVTEELREMTGPHASRHETWGNPRDVERAEAEIVEHLGLLGEGELVVEYVPVGEVTDRVSGIRGAGGVALVLGGPELDGEAFARLREVSEDPESFVISVEPGLVQVVGENPKAVLNGVYEMLEQVGFRWYMPGEFGRVVPVGSGAGLAVGEQIHAPFFLTRGRLNISRQLFSLVPDWPYRVRFTDVERVGGGHGSPPFRTGRSRQEAFVDHPEFFALIGGERRPRQLCLSNPELLEVIVNYWEEEFRNNPDNRILRISPNDGAGFCECEPCRLLDGGAMASFQTRMPSMSDRYVWIKNQVIDRLIDEFPEIEVPFLIYAGVMDPPVRWMPDLRAKWYGSLAAIHICRIHGPGNPHCPESSYPEWVAQQWSDVGLDVSVGGYYYNLACPGFPFMMIHRLRDEIPLFYEAGVRGTGAPWHNAKWASHGPSHYLASRLLWDVNVDVDAILDEFYTLFYGPAAAPMKEYTTLIDRTIYEADFHTGGSWDLIHIYDSEVRERARAALDRAVELVQGEGIYETRVEVANLGWAFYEAFAEMMEERRAFRFEEAVAALRRAEEIADALLENYEFPMVDYRGSVGARRFLAIFYGNATEAGQERLSEGRELLVGLDPEWEFLLEPQSVGERIGLYNPFYTGGNWQTINTHQSWGTQGLRYYFGEAWYRQTVDVPEVPEGRQVKLWFSGVDRGARVWINGQLLGNSPGTEFDIDAHGGITSPFEFDVTEHLLPGQPNVITVRTIRDISNELGTGGLRDVAFLYVE